MLKRTGPGIIFAHKRDPNKPGFFKRGFVSVYLANFDIDGDDLKKEHTDWLDRRLIPALGRRKTDIFIEGHASKSGKARHNKNLSERRANKALEYLKSKRIPGVKFVKPFGLGEENATTWESKRDRAVCINILDECSPKYGPCKKPEPPPPRPKPDLVRVPVREVYMSYLFQEKEFSGAMSGKVKLKDHPWKLIREDLSYAPRNADQRLVFVTDRWGIRKEFESAIQNILGMCIYVDYKVIDYYYRPSAEPTQKRKFVLPGTADKALNLYGSGIKEKNPPKKKRPKR